MVKVKNSLKTVLVGVVILVGASYIWERFICPYVHGERADFDQVKENLRFV